MKIKTIILYSLLAFSCSQQSDTVDLSGKWQFSTDSSDWKTSIQLPGSMTSNGLGEDITLNTPWTGGINDSSYFKKDRKWACKTRWEPPISTTYPKY